MCVRFFLHRRFRIAYKCAIETDSYVPSARGRKSTTGAFGGLRSKIFLLALCNFIMLDSPLWHPFFAEASDHLMPLSNLHFDKYAPRTETVDMTEKEYEERLMSLNGKMEKAYATISLSANGRKLESLARAQSAWLDMAEKYARVLRRTLDAEVKVFYGDKNKERITNIFRDNLMAIYEQRVMDLSRWAGSPKSTAFKPEKSVQELKLAIQDKGSHIEYVMNERYRMDESASREAWKKFCDAQEIFLRMFYGDEGAVEAELGLVYQRLMNLMMLQEQGVIFFHTEREE